ncbi:MAG: RNB domain-containing ribonuclease [Lentisphaeria bacterium]|nr:RNB domain-containing ribonuclease [Lentisphaeria bacterium]
MTFSIGNLVLYKQKAAIVRSVSSDKLEISIEGGSGKNVRPKDISLIHPGPAGALPPAVLPKPDCGELAELMDGETLSFAEFLDCAYGENTPSAAWSAWQLLVEGIFFTGSPEDGVKARSPEEVAASLAVIQAKEQEAAERAALLERIRTGAVDPEKDRGAIRELEQVALGALASSRLMRDLGMESAPDTAHMLLLKLGCWDEFRNPFPARAGVELGEPAFCLDAEVQDVRRDMTGLEAYAIDDAGSEDPDDAIAFADGTLYVHVADPGAAVAPEGEADLEARIRGGNLYLPDGVTPMLPREATSRFGLGLAETGPAWTFAISFAEDGQAVLQDFFLSTVRVSRHDYDSAQVLLAGPLAPAAEALEKFKEYRKSQGALFIRMPEVKVRLDNGEIQITPLPFSPVREFVANAMISAGFAVAKYTAEREIAMPYVTQVPADLPEPPAEDASLPVMHAARRACSPGMLDPWPGKHAGLGLEPYVRVTSPLRRYEDLLAQRQLRRILRGEPPMSSEEMASCFAPAEEGAYLRTRLERQVNEFYKILWFKQHPDWQGEAVVLANLDGGRSVCILPEFAYEFTTRYGNGELMPGESLPVAVELADPVTLTCRFRFV